MTRRGPIALIAAVASLALVASACGSGNGASSGSTAPIDVGAVYPLTGPDRAGGLEELRGVRLATDLVNASGGVDGRQVRLHAVDTPTTDALPGAIAGFRSDGIQVVLGSNGSELSDSAATDAFDAGMVYWETGAVGEMSGDASGRLAFKVAPSGLVLGSSGIAFIVDQMASRLHRDPASLRFVVVNVDDRYGATVADGALQEIAKRHLTLAGRFRYGVTNFDPAPLVRRIEAARPDVLFVASYIPDGVALNRELVRQRVPLLANIGTSSSYCMPEFGDELGPMAVGTFATDKPDGESLNEQGLTPEGRDLLHRAQQGFRSQYHEDMSAPALAGFSAAWALLHDVMPNASNLDADAIAHAALGVRLPTGSLPNGSGLEFSGPGSPQPGSNLRALSVIWEWVGVRQRAVVWPPRYATTAIQALPLAA
ncbi:MAG TPA: ABC transporter substrate-binding protein [Actinomycetota bacterium]|nr:ABC transporter substrate-binding protein [Actinomycetota bacterium]